ncbi:MAG: peptide ABC transporter permease [Gammaproteobacteria bacterium RIFOXYA12_FULL_61_12]|nr:MAG: peptide ABC transporter permease [Gammaproteobacteria bacterium RIFOXYA12_FULL_61_12]OGT91651.1 MAG: peptide ABC transporter permease [Gammaproteobacteria bacterium RIFOXYD12_FULL_61_37]
MRAADLINHSFTALRAGRVRSFLTMLGIAVGIAAVVVLTAVGEGVQRYVLREFTQFGANLIAVTPGKTETFGVSGAMVSNVRPLSLDDARSLERVPGIEAVVPVVQGNAAVEAGRMSRRSMILGVGSRVPDVWSMHPALGRFLPSDDFTAARGYAVLGSKMGEELFPDRSALGERIRIGSESYRVVGVMERKGQMLGFDLDDTVYIPTSRAMAMFDRESLMEIDLLYSAGLSSGPVAEQVKRHLKERHGAEDFTVVTQDQMLEVLGDILGVLTIAIGGLGGISLLVGGVGILTIMTITVNERRGEVGLLRALGARRRQVLILFLLDAVTLAGVGGLIGLGLGIGLALLAGALLPALPVSISWFYATMAEVIALLVGLASGVAPAMHAARLDPVEALRAE